MDEHELIAGLVRRMGGPIAHDEELGIRHGLTESGAVTASVPALPHTCENDNAVAQCVLTTVLDTVCGVAAMAAQGFNRSFATLDLRIDFIRPAKAGEAVLTTAEVIYNPDDADPGSIVIRGFAYSSVDTAPIALAIGRFIRFDATHVTPSAVELSPSNPPELTSYLDLMGWREVSADTLLLPFRTGLLGNGSLPSLHGGAIAALMQECASRYVNRASEHPMEVASLTVSYLTFGRPIDLSATTRPVRLGRTTATTEIIAYQNGDSSRPTATGQVTFVRKACSSPHAGA